MNGSSRVKYVHNAAHDGSTGRFRQLPHDRPNYVIPYFLQNQFNILTHSQRAIHPSSSFATPVHAIIGVSQGAAATLAFTPSSSLPSPLPTTKSITACDTSLRTAPGNQHEWEERASLAYCAKISFDVYPPLSSSTTLDDEFATQGCLVSLLKQSHGSSPRDRLLLHCRPAAAHPQPCHTTTRTRCLGIHAH